MNATADSPGSTIRKVLIIKLSALGDFIQALGPMRSIREAHPQAKITLLTTAPFADMARQCGYFDEIWTDKRPKFYHLSAWVSLARRFNRGAFDRIYDLQNNDRTGLYFHLFHPKPEWVGIAKYASHRNTSPQRSAGIAFDGHCQTLALAGLHNVQVDKMEWAGPGKFFQGLESNYALLIPGCSPKHLGKRWPASRYAALACQLSERKKIQPVFIGSKAETELISGIVEEITAEKPDGPKALSLAGKTDLLDIPALARQAQCVIGNDTGPTHIAAVTGTSSLVLFCTAMSNPVKHKPLGAAVHTLTSADLNDLSVDDVLTRLEQVQTQG